MLNDEFYACDHATLSEAFSECLDEDPNGENALIQIALRGGLQNSKIYRRQTPVWGRKFLKSKGNMLNEQCTTTTIIELWTMTAEIVVGFLRHKKKLNLDGPTPVMDARKLEYANAYCGGAEFGQWTSYQSFEVMATFYKECNKYNHKPRNEDTIWQMLVHKLQADADITSLRENAHERIANMCNEILKAFNKTSP